MNFLEERIVKDGVVKKGNVLKVDSFLNHQMDIELYNEIGKEFRRLFPDKSINKISSCSTRWARNSSAALRMKTSTRS